MRASRVRRVFFPRHNHERLRGRGVTVSNVHPSACRFVAVVGNAFLFRGRAEIVFLHARYVVESLVARRLRGHRGDIVR